MRRKKKINPDVLKQKQSELASYVQQFDSAVSMITGAVDELRNANDAIGVKIQEITDYEVQLSHTKSGLSDARARNDRVIQKFTALLE